MSIMGIKTRIASLALVLVLLGSAEVRAQEWFWAAQYQAALSSGDTKDFTDQFSFRNFAVEGRALLNDKMSAGLFLGWNVFNEEVDGTVNFSGVDINGYQFRYVNAIPILVTAHYYLGSGRGPQAYLGVGVGTYYIENRLEVGISALTDDNWHFGLAPEVGIMLPPAANMATYLSVKYNWAFEAGGFEHTYWTFGIGIGGR